MTESTSPQRSVAARIFRRLPWIVVALGVGLFFLSVRSDTADENAEADRLRTSALDRIETSLVRELEHQVNLLFAVDALFAGSEFVQRDEFATFLETAGALSRNEEIRAVEWAEMLEADPLRVEVTYVEPLEGNEAVLGFDLASSGDRLDAIERARAERSVIATAPLRLTQDDSSETGVLFVSPVYGPRGASPDGFEGVALTAFDMADLVGHVTEGMAPFVLADVGPAGDVQTERTVVFRSTADTTASQDEHVFEIAGRQWRISLGEGAMSPPTASSIALRALPTLIAAVASALVLYLLSVNTARSERRAQELTREVRKKNDELMRSNEWLESFTSVASHDLRSPLRAVNSLVGFIREDHPDLEESARFNLSRIEQRVVRMNTLIDDLLTLARVSQASETPSSTRFEDVVRDVLETVDVPPTFAVETHFDGPSTGELAVVQFKTCLQNLIDNAIKHHDRQDGRIEIRLQSTGEAVSVRVTDDGPGIPEQYLAAVFEPFRRLRPDETSPGSGIGLTAIQRTVDLNRGSIDVESTEGVGTTFTMTWPLGDQRN